MAKASSSLSYESLAIGIDIGGTGTKYGIVDRNGNVLFSGEMSTRGFAQVEDFINELHNNLLVLIDKAGGSGRMRGRSPWRSHFRRSPPPRDGSPR